MFSTSSFFYSLVALSVFSIYELLSRHVGLDSKNPRALSVAYNFVVALLTPVLLFIEPITIPQLTPVVVVVSIFSIITWSLFSRHEYYAHKNVEASTLSIILKLGPVINFFLAVAILGESLTTTKIIAFILIITANIIVVGVPTMEQIKTDKGLGYGLLITLLLGIGWTFDKVLSPVYGAIILTFINFFFPAVTNIFFPTLKFSELKAEFVAGSYKIILLALLSVIGYGAMMKAMSLGDVSQVIPITTSTTPFIVIFGAIFLGERDNIFKKFLATILIVVAIYLMR